MFNMIAAGADILGGLFQTGYNLYTNKRDFDYQKALQQTMFEREDTAVQRRMADLEAAGLNPNLAAGSAAGAGSVVSRSSTNDINIGSALDTLIATQQLKQQKDQTDILQYEKNLKWIEQDYAKEWYNYLTGGTAQHDYQSKTTPKLFEKMEMDFRNMKNSADYLDYQKQILDKTNNWFTTNQILNAAGSLLGDVSMFTPKFTKSQRIPYK